MKLVACLLLAAPAALARHAAPEFEINLDLSPEKRFLELLPSFNTTVWGFYTKYFANDAVVRDALYALSAARGKENDEMEAEVQGMADASKLPLQFVRGIQMLYEIQTLMPPVLNTSHVPEEWRALTKIPWRGPGCTGIIGKDANGTVYHARNLDFSPVPVMKDLVYVGIFTKGGKEVFRSQMIAGYSCAITGMRLGPNGFAIERNTRYPDHKKGNDEMLKNLISGRDLNGWTMRKALEEQPDYESAVAALSTTPFVSTEYQIISGVKKGTILAREPEGVAHAQVLGQPNFEERDDYIIITNFDFFWRAAPAASSERAHLPTRVSPVAGRHDMREFLDPTGGKILHPRRVAAQKLLNATASLTPENMFATINAPGVIADTIFQAVMSVETGYWNVSVVDLPTAA